MGIYVWGTGCGASELIEAGLETGKIAAENADVLLCFGELSKIIVSGAKENGMEKAFHFETKEELSENLRKTAKSGDMVWLKASRGMRFEDIAEAFYEET